MLPVRSSAPRTRASGTGERSCGSGTISDTAARHTSRNTALGIRANTADAHSTVDGSTAEARAMSAGRRRAGTIARRGAARRSPSRSRTVSGPLFPLESSTISPDTHAGSARANACDRLPPSECPTRTTRSIPHSSHNATRSSSASAAVKRRSGDRVDCPWPRMSQTSTRYPAAARAEACASNMVWSRPAPSVNSTARPSPPLSAKTRSAPARARRRSRVTMNRPYDDL